MRALATRRKTALLAKNIIFCVYETITPAGLSSRARDSDENPD
jgi:hypothetical protein